MFKVEIRGELTAGVSFVGSSLVVGVCDLTACDRKEVSLLRICFVLKGLVTGVSSNSGGIKDDGVGGTGLASCASSEGTFGKLEGCVEPVDPEVVVQAVFCNNCFSKTFCESSILCEVVLDLLLSESALDINDFSLESPFNRSPSISFLTAGVFDVAAKATLKLIEGNLSRYNG